jgi:hypothetical protein
MGSLEDHPLGIMAGLVLPAAVYEAWALATGRVPTISSLLWRAPRWALYTGWVILGWHILGGRDVLRRRPA